MLKLITFALAGFLSIAGTRVAAAQVIDYAAINTDVLTSQILPAHEAFAAKGEALAGAVGALCAKPDAGALTAAQEAFQAAADAWQAVEHLRFGPEQATSAHARLNFWPDKHGRVAKHLRRLMAGSDTSVLRPTAFAKGSVAVQGFPALERLLFGDGALDELRKVAQPITACAVARAVAANIAAIAKELAGRWRQTELTGARAKDATGELFKSLAGGLQAASEIKIGGPLGLENGRLRPKRAENWRSGRALRNVAVNLRALRELYDGLTKGGGHDFRGSDEDKLIRGLFDRAIAETEARGPSLIAALEAKNGALLLKTLTYTIDDLRELVVPNTAEALDLVLGFNSFDGD